MTHMSLGGALPLRAARVAAVVWLGAHACVHAATPTTNATGQVVLMTLGGDAKVVLDASQGTPFMQNGTMQSITFSPVNLAASFGGGGSIYGDFRFMGTSTLTPVGGWSPDATLTVAGTYDTTGGAFFYFGGYNPNKVNIAQRGHGDFSFTYKLSDVLNYAKNLDPLSGFSLANWSGPVPYGDSIKVSLTTLVLSQSSGVVPESSTLAMMALGLLGLGLKVRSQRCDAA
jgi:hypothetical protein